jgi:hypothetical protein
MCTLIAKANHKFDTIHLQMVPAAIPIMLTIKSYSLHDAFLFDPCASQERGSQLASILYWSLMVGKASNSELFHSKTLKFEYRITTDLDSSSLILTGRNVQYLFYLGAYRIGPVYPVSSAGTRCEKMPFEANGERT